VTEYYRFSRSSRHRDSDIEKYKLGFLNDPLSSIVSDASGRSASPLRTYRRCLRILIRFRSIPLSDIYLRPLRLVLGDGREDTYCAFSAECRAAFRETRNTRRSRFPMLEHGLGPTSAVCIFVFSCRARRCLGNFSPGIDFNDQREPRGRGGGAGETRSAVFHPRRSAGGTNRYGDGLKI